MTEQHPITPPPELMKGWIDAWYNAKVKHANMTEFVAIQAARWGADQELEACCMWLSREVCDGWGLRQQLRAARRPKPPSLKEQALAWCNDYIDPDGVIRRALETLPDD